MNPIKERMQNYGITFTDLQNDTKISKATIARIIKEDKIPENTRISTLKAISKTLNCSISELLTSSSVNNASFESRPTNTKKFPDINRFAHYYHSHVLFEDQTTAEFKIVFIQNSTDKKISSIAVYLEDDPESTIKVMVKNNYHNRILKIITNMLKSCNYPINNYDEDIFCDFNANISDVFFVSGNFIFNFSDYKRNHFM